MSLRRLLSRIRGSEGSRLDVHRADGVPTVGFLHRVRWSDRLHIGDTITPQQAYDWLHADTLQALLACEAQVAGWDQLSEETQEDAAYNVFIYGPGALNV